MQLVRCSFICVCVRVCALMHACVRTPNSGRSQRVNLGMLHSTLFFRQDLSVNLELSSLARWADSKPQSSSSTFPN